MQILCFDAGSSSLKYGVYEMDGASERALFEESAQIDAPVGDTFRRLDAMGIHPGAAGHRIVFGGHHEAPAILTRSVRDELGAFAPIDPLHLPAQLRIVDAVSAWFPSLSQILCFDTAFHRAMPRLAQRLPLPADVDPLLQKYGFHGLSYEYIATTFDAQRYRRTVVAHLGSGASLAAMLDGKPWDTTMGFSPLGGLMMGTRSGDLDPGILLYLLRERDFTPERLSALLNEHSGLLGVSGESADMQTLIARSHANPAALEAIDLFAYTAAKFVGAMATALGGLDLLVFTGGIGEHAAPVRQRICAPLRAFGVRLAARANTSSAAVISSEGSNVEVRVTPTREALTIARHTFRALGRTNSLAG